MIEIKTKSKGAELTSIKLNGEEKLHNGEEFWNRHSPILFPIVGKLKENKTEINGKTYEMTQHGFARDLEFEEVGNHQYSLKSNEETMKKFPFNFELNVSYEVQENKVITNYEVINKDDKEMLFGLGGHPAYCLDYTNENYDICFEKYEDEIKVVQLKDGLISNEKIEKEKYINNNRVHLTKNIFENDAIIFKDLVSSKVVVKNNQTNKTILEFDFEGFPYLALWSKKGAPFVCIEPWFNTADKVDSNGIFEEKEDLIELKPKQKFKCKYQVEFF